MVQHTLERNTQMSTKITADEFKKQFLIDDEIDLPRENRVSLSEAIEHKLVILTEVWKHNDQFFEVCYCRDNTGYWGDGENYEPEVYEVFPKLITKTIYVHG